MLRGLGDELDELVLVLRKYDPERDEDEYREVAQLQQHGDHPRVRRPRRRDDRLVVSLDEERRLCRHRVRIRVKMTIR